MLGTAARALGIPRSTVWDAIRRFRETGSYTPKPGEGRQRCTSTRDIRFVDSNLLRNRYCIATEARTRLLATWLATHKCSRDSASLAAFAQKYADRTVEEWQDIPSQMKAE